MPNITPSYLTTGAGGEAGAVFPGGILLPAVETPSGYAVENTVQWVRQSDGAQIAHIVGRRSGDHNALEIRSDPPAAIDDFGSVRIATDWPGGDFFTDLKTEYNGTTGEGAVTASGKIGPGPGTGVIIIDSEERSSFPMLRTPENTFLCGGLIDATGAVLTRIPTLSWTIAKLAVGSYRITYSTPYTGQPLVLAVAAGGGNRAAVVSQTQSTFCDISTFVATTGAALDTFFIFAVLGRS